MPNFDAKKSPRTKRAAYHYAVRYALAFFVFMGFVMVLFVVWDLFEGDFNPIRYLQILGAIAILAVFLGIWQANEVVTTDNERFLRAVLGEYMSLTDGRVESEMFRRALGNVRNQRLARPNVWDLDELIAHHFGPDA